MRPVMRHVFLRLSSLACCALMFVACATGGTPDPGVREEDAGDAMDLGEPPAEDAATSDCVPACAPTQLCRLGTCIEPLADADGDGVATAEDCDDTAPLIGRSSSRACTSPCGVGTETCTTGTWGPCSAPTTCECTDGDPPRDVPCGFCGTQQQLCVGGRWMNAGGCSASGECAAGSVESGGACGRCGTRMRACDSTCAWGAESCVGEGECVAGTVETDTQPCGCGTRSRTRTCTSSCGWGPWSAFGACSGASECVPGATRQGSCDMCSQEVCTSACTWSGTCSLRPGNACDYEAGTNFRACTGGTCTTSRCWQFCSTSCQYFTCQNRP
jgi:hypothetical protein